MEEVMNQIKKIAGAAIKRLLLIMLPFILIIIILAGAVYMIKGIDAGHDEGEEGDTGEVVDKTITVIASNGFRDYGSEWALDIDFNVAADEIIKEIEENGGRVYEYLGRESAKDYMIKFIKAELVTQYPDLRSDPTKIGTDTSGGQFQGCIQIKRALSNGGESKTLTFVHEQKFNEECAKNIPNDPNVLDHFTIDTSGNIVVAGWTKVTTTIGGGDITREEQRGTTEDFRWEKRCVPYKNLIEKHTMPFDFLWALTVMGEDPEFVSKVADLALNSKIVITIQENLSTTVFEEKDTYDLTRYIKKTVTSDLIVDGAITPYRKEEIAYTWYSWVDYFFQGTTKTVKITTEDCAIQSDITFADTWIAQYENNYSNLMPDAVTPAINSVNVGTEDVLIRLEEADEDFFNRCHEEIINKLTELWGSDASEGRIAKEGVDYRYTKKLIEYRAKRENMIRETSNSETYNIYIKGTPTVIDKSNQFITLFNESTTAKSYITSEPAWLFDALKGNETTSEMVDLVKYLIYKSTSKEYGITEFDFNIYDTSTR